MILKASVLIVLLCLIFGICFRYRYRLAEPVFVQQNTAVTAIFDDSEAKPGWYADVTFYYITGRGDDRLVQHIDFSQLQPAGNNAGDEASLKEFTETIESKGQYLLHTLGGKLFVPSGEPLENYRVVTEGNVYYTDGSSAVTELGNLIFEPDSRVNTVAGIGFIRLRRKERDGGADEKRRRTEGERGTDSGAHIRFLSYEIKWYRAGAGAGFGK